jgi:hypothetical protein
MPAAAPGIWPWRWAGLSAKIGSILSDLGDGSSSAWLVLKMEMRTAKLTFRRKIFILRQ